MTARREWWLYFTLAGETIEIVEYRTLGYTYWLNATLQLLASLKAVVGFVLGEMLQGLRAELLHEKEEEGEL